MAAAAAAGNGLAVEQGGFERVPALLIGGEEDGGVDLAWIIGPAVKPPRIPARLLVQEPPRRAVPGEGAVVLGEMQTALRQQPIFGGDAAKRHMPGDAGGVPRHGRRLLALRA